MATIYFSKIFLLSLILWTNQTLFQLFLPKSIVNRFYQQSTHLSIILVVITYSDFPCIIIINHSRRKALKGFSFLQNCIVNCSDQTESDVLSNFQMFICGWRANSGIDKMLGFVQIGTSQLILFLMCDNRPESSLFAENPNPFLDTDYESKILHNTEEILFLTICRFLHTINFDTKSYKFCSPVHNEYFGTFE